MLFGTKSICSWKAQRNVDPSPNLARRGKPCSDIPRCLRPNAEPRRCRGSVPRGHDPESPEVSALLPWNFSPVHSCTSKFGLLHLKECRPGSIGQRLGSPLQVTGPAGTKAFGLVAGYTNYVDRTETAWSAEAESDRPTRRGTDPCFPGRTTSSAFPRTPAAGRRVVCGCPGNAFRKT